MNFIYILIFIRHKNEVMEKSDNHKILKARKQMNEQELIYQI